MTEDELNAIVESKLADRLAARLQADRERCGWRSSWSCGAKRERKHYDRINKKASRRRSAERGSTPLRHAARLKAMSAAARKRER